MGYTPYKMLGHELKGPNQKDPSPTTMKAFGTNDTEFLDQESTDAGTSPTNYGSAVGGSPNKLDVMANNAADAASAGAEAVDAKAAGGGAKMGGMLGGIGAAVSGAPASEVPSHGDESHTGGAVGGEPKEAPWEVMKSGAFSDMDKGARKDYMGGLDKSQRMQQTRSNMEGRLKGGFGGMGGFGSTISGMFSDIRLKEKIEKTGNSPSGIPTYEFNYIGDNSRYSGVMAQDLIEMNIDAVSMDDSGFYKVNYNNIDVDMHQIN